MNKLFSKKFIFAIFLAAAVLLPKPVLAGNLINATFQSTPSLFGEANFLPGDSITKWVKVANVSPAPVSITAVLENYTDPDGLGGQFDVTVKEHNASENIFSGTLTALAAPGGALLNSSLAENTEIQYDFSVTFKPAAGNDYQNKSLQFDIAIRASSQSGGEVEILGGSDGGGGSSYYSSADNQPPVTPSQFNGLKYPETGTVAGEQTTIKPLAIGKVSGHAAFVDRGWDQNGEVLGESVTQAMPLQATYPTCRQFPWWWLGYLVYIILLFAVFWLFQKVNKWWIYIVPVILFVAAMLWWWYEPCPVHWWVWPAIITVIFIITAWWHRYNYSRLVAVNKVLEPEDVQTPIEPPLI